MSQLGKDVRCVSATYVLPPFTNTHRYISFSKFAGTSRPPFHGVTPEMPLTLTGSMLAGLFLFIPGLLAVNEVSLKSTGLRVCALQGATAKLRCLYPPNSKHGYTNLYWFKVNQKWKWRGKTIPEDLVTDPEYEGRLVFDRSFIEIRNLRKSDKGDYHFRFKAEPYGWMNSARRINLIVTNLQMRMSPALVKKGKNVTLICSTTCTLSDNPTYIWYKNGKMAKCTKTSRVYLTSVSRKHAGSYSCAIKGYEDLRAPAVCLLGNCWNVSYTPNTICGFAGSYVDLPCTYTYPRSLNITETLWVNNTDLKMEPEDLSRYPEYEGRVEYRGNGRDCTLRIKDLRKSDSAKYRFLFKKAKGTYFNSSAVSLSVTDLHVHVYPAVVEEGDFVWIRCHTHCGLLQSYGGFIWYKDGQRILNPNQDEGYMILNIVSSEDAGSYSCALVGQELRSLEATLTVTKGPVPILTIVLGLVVFLTVGALLVFIYSTLKRRNAGGYNTRTNTQTVNNDDAFIDSSSNHENIEHIYADPDENDDMYTALRRGHLHFVYETIQRRESPQDLD
ncbi:sialoadhesin-like [Coregonus clupeaformis]|uniref:sialoadhesin-like n=1 Tax=Coregonus clupeaformis TaxID=59861 RepID=UPI001E1C9B6D|nr:sialoadhesin-like [Coregonus clupeaformis]